MKYKLGKLPPCPETPRLRLADYLDHRALPAPPANFGHETLVSRWGMLGNDTVGDCAIAAPYHAIELWNAEAQRPVSINAQCVIDAYSEITGYDPADYDPDTQSNPTDQGSRISEVAAYWHTQGLRDAAGQLHHVDAYAALEPGDVTQLLQAMFLLDGVQIGVALPQQWMDAFEQHQVWDALPNPDVIGGHCVLGVGCRDGNPVVVTWGATQLLTPAGYHQACDEAWVVFSSERLRGAKDIDGFDRHQLLADMQALARE